MNPLLSALVTAGLLSGDDAARLDRQLDSAAAREYAERQMLLAFHAGLSGQRDRLIDAVRASEGLLTIAQQNRLWQGENERLWNSVRDTLLDVASERAITATMSAGDASMWELVNEQVIEWADGYYLSEVAENVGSIPNLNQTSRTRFSQAFVDWQRGELETAGFADGLPNLIRSLEPVFGMTRAESIAVTETTRIHSYAEIAAGEANPFVVGWVYNTANDSLVSDLCRPANGTVMRKGETTFPDGLGPPPRHVRCRSFITAVSEGALGALQERGEVGSTPRQPFLPTIVPEPVQATESVPTFGTVKEAEDWARENLSFASSVRYDGLQVETANAINKHLADRLTQVGHLRKFTDGKLRSILTQESKGDWHMAMNQDTAILSINRKYDTLDKWYDMWDRDTEHQQRHGVPFSSKRYFAREKAIKITLDHEIGHSVQWSFTDEQKKAWAKATRDAGRSGWQRPTGYAAKDKQEEFAECFAVYVNGRPDLLTPDMVTFLENLLREP